MEFDAVGHRTKFCQPLPKAENHNGFNRTVEYTEVEGTHQNS